MGLDQVKPEEDLIAAYDDAQGVTAAFNKNLLVRINRELGGEAAEPLDDPAGGVRAQRPDGRPPGPPLDELDDAEIERSIREINEAIQRSSQKRR